MEMRKFGKTNLETSAVVFGGGFVGGIKDSQVTAREMNSLNYWKQLKTRINEKTLHECLVCDSPLAHPASASVDLLGFLAIWDCR